MWSNQPKNFLQVDLAVEKKRSQTRFGKFQLIKNQNYKGDFIIFFYPSK